MNIFILGLVAFVGISSGYIIQLPGQCKPESAFKLEDVIYKVEDVSTFYLIDSFMDFSSTRRFYTYLS